MSGRRIILTDIDHVLSNAFWRDPMIGGPWDDYHAASSKDEPLHDVVEMLRSLAKDGWTVIGITARPAKWRKQTMEWMIKHDVPMHELLMREDEDFRRSPPMKEALAKARFKELRDEVAIMLDDRDDVIAMFKGYGVTCMQVHGRKQ